MSNVSLRLSFPLVALAAGACWTTVASAQVVADSDSVNPTIEGSLSAGYGAALLKGSQAAFQEHFQHTKEGFGGVEELRFHRETKLSILSLDAHAVLGDGSYHLSGRYTRNENAYVDFGYDKYSIFYDGNGVEYAPSNTIFQVGDPKLQVNLTKIWLELGYVPENSTQYKIRYERNTRSGDSPSTELGDSNLTGGAGTRSIVPSFLLLNETRDIVTADAGREADNYQWQAGVRYEHDSVNDGRENDRRPLETQNRIATSKDDTRTDLFTGHGFYEQHFGDKLVISAGGLISTLDTNIGGSRIFGADYDALYDPAFAHRQAFDIGFLDLAGGAQLKDYVVNLNAVYHPTKNWVIQPGLRYEHLNLDNVSSYEETSVANNLSTSAQDLQAQSQKQENQVTESLEVRYNPKASWNLSFRGEWFQTVGNLNELQVDQVSTATTLSRFSDYNRDSQKYTVDFRWYAKPGLTFTGEYYYKLRGNDYDALRDSTPAGSADRYPAFITDQEFSTHDVNVRVSWRPLSMLSLVTRYDFQYSNVMTGFQGIPELENGRMTTHIISQSFTWNPITNLYLTSSANVTYNQLATPATALISNCDNNYVNISMGAGYALGKITDLYLDGNHYLAKDYINNAARTLPLGADQRTDDVSVSWVRRQTERLIYTVKYTYAMNRDGLAGGINDYRANIIYGKVQYKF